MGVFVANAAKPKPVSDGELWFSSLQKRLIAEGWEKNGVIRLYAHPDIRFDVEGVSLYFVHREGKLDYDQFKRPARIQSARKYLQKHKTTFDDAEKAYGVNRNVIAAVLLVETNLGGYLGTRSVLNTLSTMSALQDAAVRKRLWKLLSQKTDMTRAAYRKKALRKSGWAYEELKAFFIHTWREKINPLGVPGSYAGAMGICQFMPTNILTLAADGDNDGHIDLFSHPDAIHSVARYLQHYGWKKNIDRQRAYKAVYAYNHSDPYVTVVLEIADLLSKTP